MIIQTIKSWLNKLFTWWPWKRSSATKYPQVVSNLSKGMTQEQMWQRTIEAPMSQSGITSVVVEHEVEENIPELQPQHPPTDERSERVPPQAKRDEQSTTPHTSSGPTDKDTTIFAGNVLMPSPGDEQQLEFLRYLVQQGVVNEGFAEGQVPSQYQSKQKE